MTFKSRVDWWYYAILIAAATLALLELFGTLTQGPGRSTVGVSFVLLILVGLPLWLLLSTSYRVDTGTLYVRSGPFLWQIPLREIHSVRESHSWLSSPALPLKRIEINYGDGKSILLSPRDRAPFMKAIGQQLISQSMGTVGS